MSDKHRAMMAAHLCDLAGHEARTSGIMGLVLPLLSCASRVANEHHPAEECYRHGLAIAGLTPEQADAAVASVQRGEWPADSLPARVAKMRDDAQDQIERAAYAVTAAEYRGKRDAFRSVLALLGVAP